MIRIVFLFMASATLIAFSATDVSAQCYGGHGGHHGGFAYYGSPGISVSYGSGYYGGPYGHVHPYPATRVYYGGYGHRHYPAYRTGYYPPHGYRPYYGGGYGHGCGYGGGGWSVGIRF